MRVVNNGFIHSELTSEWILIVEVFATKVPGSSTRAEKKHESLPVKIFNSLRCENKIIHATLNKTCERSKSENLDDCRCYFCLRHNLIETCVLRLLPFSLQVKLDHI